ncbi:MAG TPA: hypothetical protein VM011_04980 [Gammaproteobacteria bacterium]|nr:hypothetical protein [Gammaproteobacteria bacterium]
MRSRLPGQQGIALLIVLWIVALLSIIAGSSAISVRTQTAIVDNRVVSAQARAAAQAGLHYAAFELLKQNAAERWRTDGTVYELGFADARLRITAVEEAGKVSLNAAPGDLLGRLLRAAGIDNERAAALVDVILDWRDPDDLRRVNGAEQDDYRAAGRSYLPRNSTFQSNDEVALVLGMQPDDFARIQGAVTAYSGSAHVDPAVAVPLVRLALNGGMPGDAESTQSAPASTALGILRPTAPGALLSVHVEAEMPGGVRERLTAVIKLRPAQQGAAFAVFSWQEQAEAMRPAPTAD